MRTDQFYSFHLFLFYGSQISSFKKPGFSKPYRLFQSCWCGLMIIRIKNEKKTQCVYLLHFLVGQCGLHQLAGYLVAGLIHLWCLIGASWSTVGMMKQCKSIKIYHCVKFLVWKFYGDAVFTKFQNQEIRWNYGFLRSVKQKCIRNYQ